MMTIHGVLPVISFAAAIGKLTHLCRRQIGKTGKYEKAKENLLKLIQITRFKLVFHILCLF